MNRATLTGSVIVGIAVMMSISMIAPAFAANPWRDVFICEENKGSEPVTLGGTEEWVVNNGDEVSEVCTEDIVRADCTSKSGTEGHVEFKDRGPDYGKQTDNEQTRCHKSNFWILP